jgi:class 3 adenylate cyclase
MAEPLVLIVDDNEKNLRLARAVGTVMNLASRLCDEAKAGQILISARALASVEDKVGAEPVGELTLKGFAKPVSAYDVVAMKVDPAEFEPAVEVAAQVRAG